MNSAQGTTEFTVPTVTEHDLARVHQELDWMLRRQEERRVGYVLTLKGLP